MKAWQEFLITLEAELGKQTVDFWLRPLQVSSPQEGMLHIIANDSFQVLWFEEHVRPIAETRLVDSEGKKWRVKITSNTSSEESDNSTAPSRQRSKKLPALAHPALEIGADTLDPYSTFDQIHEYAGNRLAKKALQQLSTSLEHFVIEGFNPLYVYGPVGCGKSALLMAAARQLQLTGHKVLYVKGETFTQHVVQAIRLGMMQEFRRFYRGVDALLLDGIEVFSHKAATQEEFFHTFNSLHVEAKAIVVSSKVAPKDLKGIEPRLISRFEWGLMISIDPPSPKEMEGILRTHCSRLKIALTVAQGKWLIEQFGSHGGLLARALAALALRAHRQKVQLASLHPHELMPLLQDIKHEQLATSLSAEKIVQVISDYYGITTKDILGKCQRREFSLPRQIAMYLCRQKLEMPFQKIALLFGRDHSTVMASCKLINKALLEKSSRVSRELPMISQKL